MASSRWDDSGVSVDLAGLVGFAPHLVILNLPVTLDESALQEKGFQSRSAEHRRARRIGTTKKKAKSTRAYSLVRGRRRRRGGEWKRRKGGKRCQKRGRERQGERWRERQGGRRLIFFLILTLMSMTKRDSAVEGIFPVWSAAIA